MPWVTRMSRICLDEVKNCEDTFHISCIQIMMCVLNTINLLINAQCSEGRVSIGDRSVPITKRAIGSPTAAVAPHSNASISSQSGEGIWVGINMSEETTDGGTCLNKKYICLLLLGPRCPSSWTTRTRNIYIYTPVYSRFAYGTLRRLCNRTKYSPRYYKS